jgi:hypothetical protein
MSIFLLILVYTYYNTEEEERKKYTVIMNNYIGVINIFVLICLGIGILYVYNQINAALKRLDPIINNLDAISDGLLSANTLQNRVDNLVTNIEEKVSPQVLENIIQGEGMDYLQGLLNMNNLQDLKGFIPLPEGIPPELPLE